MMRTSFRPLAHLVDAAAERWLAVADAAERERCAVREEITGAFRIGNQSELTFHGYHYLLSITRAAPGAGGTGHELCIDVHRIELGS